MLRMSLPVAVCVSLALWLGAAPALAVDRQVATGYGGGSLLGALVCGYIASTKKRNPWGWALFGFFCCPVALVCVLLASPGTEA